MDQSGALQITCNSNRGCATVLRGRNALKRILVTGGTGFVGLRTVAALEALGHCVRIFDLSPRRERLPASVSAQIVSGDIADQDAVAAAAAECDGIIHLAGLMTVDCARDPVRAAHVNLIGSINVFQAAKQRRLPVAYLSTAGVFGPEDAVHPKPMTIYGATKLAVEGVARAFLRDHGVPSLALRPYIIYGPGISSGIAAGPSIAIAAALRHEPAEIRFSGRVGFVYVDDVSSILAAAMTAPLEGATALTMTGETADMQSFVSELRAQTGWSHISISGPPLTIPADLSSDPVPACLAPQPVTGIATGIRRSLAALEGLKVGQSSNV
ncbi:MAG: NAD-dependent epimerase/dehydratase family protein [Pseudorhizobium sp.]